MNVLSVAELERAIAAEEALSTELEQYSGEWVAVLDHTVVAHALTLAELREQIGEAEVEGVFQVPEGNASACFF